METTIIEPKTRAAEIHSQFRKNVYGSTIQIKDIIDNPEIETAVERLSKIGLTSSKTYNKMRKHVDDKQSAKEFNDMVKQIARIEAAHPSYRLIGLKKVLELCKKYNLYIGMMSDYTGVVPNKNLKEIEAHMAEMNKGSDNASIENINELFTHAYEHRYTTIPKYIIAAPRKDFESGLIAIGRSLQRIEKPKFVMNFNLAWPQMDPIVMSPLNIKGAAILQIATAWGAEADDDYITNKIPVAVNNN